MNAISADEISQNISVQAHVWSAMGRERYQCRCGQKYLTGATEWDHFRGHERKRRIVDILFFGAFFSAFVSPVSLFVYLFMHFCFGLGRSALNAALVIGACPFFLFNMPFWFEIIMSMWRTRISTNIVSD
jgi:hypothetical protein